MFLDQQVTIYAQYTGDVVVVVVVVRSGRYQFIEPATPIPHKKPHSIYYTHNIIS